MGECVIIPKYNSEDLKHKQVQEQHIDKLIEGYTVIGCETINYPVTEGIILYLEDRLGKPKVLTIRATEEDPCKYIGVTIANL